MTEELKRKLVYEAEYYVASHRPHKVFTLDDVNNIVVGFAEKCLTEATKELQETTKSSSPIITNCAIFKI